MRFCLDMAQGRMNGTSNETPKLLNTQNYKVRIKGKMEQSREWINVLPYTSVEKLWKKLPSSHPRLRPPTLLILFQVTIFI